MDVLTALHTPHFQNESAPGTPPDSTRMLVFNQVAVGYVEMVYSMFNAFQA